MVTLGASALLGSAVGLVADRLVGEPPGAVHPVAGFGRVMERIEHRVYADRRVPGVAYAVAGALLGLAAGRAVGRTSVAVALASAGRMLRVEARGVQQALDAGDLDAARAALPTLVGRDPSTLDASGMSAAVIESVAENTVDAVVAPALWGATFGAAGAACYRAVNTMDAMVGHHSERYEHFGWGSARLDDAAGFLPARATVALVCVAQPSRARAVLEASRRDAAAHPSPNAGRAEAAFAAALAVELGGPLQYGTRREDRPRLGVGPRPQPHDIGRAIRLADRVEVALVALLAAAGGVALLAERRRRR
jgi:adenosylcobinamide-phosphate synthase